MNPYQPQQWAMKWFMYAAQNEKTRFEYDRAPMLAMRVQKCPCHSLMQLQAVYEVAHARQRRFATRRRGTPSMGGTTVANAETISGAAHAAGRAEVLTTPREFPALTPRVTERLT